MPKKEIISSLQNKDLPYSPVVKIGNHYHFSGLVPDINAAKQLSSPGDIITQTGQIITKMTALLNVCGLSLNDVYSVTIMLSGSMEHFATVNKLYVGAFSAVEIMPRRKAFAVVALPYDAMIEIEFDAVKQD